jgi:hypothetical protein
MSMKSGDRPLVVEPIASFGGGDEIAKGRKANLFP